MSECFKVYFSAKSWFFKIYILVIYTSEFRELSEATTHVEEDGDETASSQELTSWNEPATICLFTTRILVEY